MFGITSGFPGKAIEAAEFLTLTGSTGTLIDVCHVR